MHTMGETNDHLIQKQQSDTKNYSTMTFKFVVDIKIWNRKMIVAY